VREEPERQVEEMEERAKEVERDIEQAAEDWEATQQEVPSADRQEDKPVDEDNPVGGL
jgi:hypothetical protein